MSIIYYILHIILYIFYIYYILYNLIYIYIIYNIIFSCTQIWSASIIWEVWHRIQAGDNPTGPRFSLSSTGANCACKVFSGWNLCPWWKSGFQKTRNNGMGFCYFNLQLMFYCTCFEMTYFICIMSHGNQTSFFLKRKLI